MMNGEWVWMPRKTTEEHAIQEEEHTDIAPLSERNSIDNTKKMKRKKAYHDKYEKSIGKTSMQDNKLEKSGKREKRKPTEKKGKKESHNFEEIWKMKDEIERAIQEIDGGRFNNLLDYTPDEKVLLFQKELLDRIREAKEYRDTLQRVAADFDNYRKRMEKRRRT